MVAKLYVVARADLPPGAQATQALHAGLQFAHDHPEAESAWFRSSNTLALLAVPDERALQRLLDRAFDERLLTSVFREEDLDGAMTAAAFEPAAGRILRGLPKLLDSAASGAAVKDSARSLE